MKRFNEILAFTFLVLAVFTACGGSDDEVSSSFVSVELKTPSNLLYENYDIELELNINSTNPKKAFETSYKLWDENGNKVAAGSLPSSSGTPIAQPHTIKFDEACSNCELEYEVRNYEDKTEVYSYKLPISITSAKPIVTNTEYKSSTIYSTQERHTYMQLRIQLADLPNNGISKIEVPNSRYPNFEFKPNYMDFNNTSFDVEARILDFVIKPVAQLIIWDKYDNKSTIFFNYSNVYTAYDFTKYEGISFE